jgi:hypothetical protein
MFFYLFDYNGCVRDTRTFKYDEGFNLKHSTANDLSQPIRYFILGKRVNLNLITFYDDTN